MHPAHATQPPGQGRRDETRRDDRPGALSRTHAARRPAFQRANDLHRTGAARARPRLEEPSSGHLRARSRTQAARFPARQPASDGRLQPGATLQPERSRRTRAAFRSAGARDTSALHVGIPSNTRMHVSNILPGTRMLTRAAARPTEQGRGPSSAACAVAVAAAPGLAPRCCVSPRRRRRSGPCTSRGMCLPPATRLRPTSFAMTRRTSARSLEAAADARSLACTRVAVDRCARQGFHLPKLDRRNQQKDRDGLAARLTGRPAVPSGHCRHEDVRRARGR